MPKTETLTLSREELEQLILNQKMQVLGRFAEKVVHDLNNMLTAVMLNSRLLLMDLPKEDPTYADIDDILHAGDKAVALLRQLSTVSRVKDFKPNKTNLNAVISNLKNSLCRLVGEKIKLSSHLDPSLQNVKGDPRLIQELILNLVENACQAMPQGGKLTIETKKADFRKAASFVSLYVGDTGLGIDPEIQPFIFEPFFTTDEENKGRGWGLTTVYQIVKRHEGKIFFTSEPGQGTKFEIHLPVDHKFLETEELGIKPIKRPHNEPTPTLKSYVI